jgi:hypothetical protein
MHPNFRILPTAAKALTFAVLLTLPAPSQQIPPHKKPIPLFNGHDLSNFDTVLKSGAINSDPDHIFTVQDGLIHISGHEFGYIVTRQSYSYYALEADFKWGTGTFAPREGMARDSGILFNIQGPPKVWPQSIEFQITEGGTGDYYVIDGAALTDRDGKRVACKAGGSCRIDHIGKGTDIKNVMGFRDPVGDMEKPTGQWNHLLLIVDGAHISQYVNGKLANQGTDVSPAEGKILFQSEGAEVFYKNINLYPLK